MSEITNLEQTISLHIIREDLETVISLLGSENDFIFKMEMYPYYALFMQSCQEFFRDFNTDASVSTSEAIKEIRNKIHLYDDGFSKSANRILDVDCDQNDYYRSKLKYNILKKFNFHYNLGTYWTEDHHIIGNTQHLAYLLGIDELSDEEIQQKQHNLGYTLGNFVAELKNGFVSRGFTLKPVYRSSSGTQIEWYHDFNTDLKPLLFDANKSKELNLMLLHLLCGLNFIELILKPLLDPTNKWLFRIQYISTYYTYRSLVRMKNSASNNPQKGIDLARLESLLSGMEAVFQSRFRNIMMHYNLKGSNLVSSQNLDKPFYGLIELCFEGKNFDTYRQQLQGATEQLIEFLEGNFDCSKVELHRL